MYCTLSFKKKLVVLSLVSILSSHASSEPGLEELVEQEAESALEDLVAAKEALEATKKEVEILPFPSDLKLDLEQLHIMYMRDQKTTIDIKDLAPKLGSKDPESIKKFTKIIALNTIKSAENTAARNKKIKQSLAHILFNATVAGVAVLITGYLVMRHYSTKDTVSINYAIRAAAIGTSAGMLGESFRQYVNNDFRENEFTQIRKNSKYWNEQRGDIHYTTKVFIPEEEQRMIADAAKLAEEYKKNYIHRP